MTLFYLGATSAPLATSGFNRPQSMTLSHSPAIPPPNQASRVRVSILPPSRVSGTPLSNQSTFVSQPPPTANVRPIEPTVDEHDEGSDIVSVHLERTTSSSSASSGAKSENRKSRNGSLNREFKFPPPSPVLSAHGGDSRKPSSPPIALASEHLTEEEAKHTGVITPSSIEVPPPPPLEKEKSISKISLDDSVDDDVGDMVDISLNRATLA